MRGLSSGGPEGIRTPDLLNAIEARSQLRHRPTRSGDAIFDLMRSVRRARQSSVRCAAFDVSIERARVSVNNSAYGVF